MKTQAATGFDVIVCGSLHLDVMVQASALPRLDETVVGQSWGMKCGGKGGNQAAMASKLGARTAMIGRIGDDDFGKRLLGNLQACTIETGAISVDSAAGSGMSVALSLPSGDYGAVIVSGANLSLDPHDCFNAWNRLGGAKVLVLQNEIPHAVNVSVAQAARASGAIVVLNAAPARTMTQDLLACVDVLVVNRIEAEMLSGVVVHDAACAAIAAEKLGELCANIVLTLGADGLAFKVKGVAAKAIEPVPVRMVSSHGAGDCFTGSLAHDLAQGFDLETACMRANANAARFVAMTETEQAGFRGIAA